MFKTFYYKNKSKSLARNISIGNNLKCKMILKYIDNKRLNDIHNGKTLLMYAYLNDNFEMFSTILKITLTNLNY